ncbi:NADPH-dependent F420 reductase [Sandaracinus amylolyticus]|uniref:NADPH-dependent F420 reductase n=1 Tax=Sandaracinus amylolyticus TaxID=927083 RepID=UPI001F48FA70|nr:NAD(P)-binding domain-containing protein [Sandaracinus amylolyticus]UJR78403.1 putative dinucleotide-binding enzyme [Sandaracinus amylolyticus]
MHDEPKIGILGTGDVGRALGSGFIDVLGDRVTIGARDPRDPETNERMGTWLAKHRGKGELGAFAAAVEGADIVVLATLWTGTKSAIDMAGGPAALAGKVVIDVTNPLQFTGHGPELALAHTDSGGEQVQRWLPGAKVVKAFNTIGNALMVKPTLAQGTPTMFFCGNDEGAKKVVGEIVTSFGHDGVDIGGLDGARLLEPLCILWVRYGMRTKSWGHAFSLLRK